MKLNNVSRSVTFNLSTEEFQSVDDKINKHLEEGDHKGVEKAKIAEIALAVGLKTNEKEPNTSSESKAVKLSSMKNDAPKVLVEQKNPNKEIDELIEEMQKYMEGGIQQMAENIEENSTLHYTDYIE
jgi:hypothetical protein